MSDVVIELHNVSKSYAVGGPGSAISPGARLSVATRQAAAVDGFSLQVERGEIVALLGPSGCGKTTTLRLIAGLESPDDGEVWVNGRRVAGAGSWAPPEARRVGLVFQDYALFPHLTVSKNIAFPLNGMRSRLRKERVGEMLRLVGLDGLGERYPHELSGGQQQRVALARALAPEPAVILLDEPFSNLDADSRASVRDHVRSVLKTLGATVIFVTHDQEEALLLGDRVAVMSQGKLEQVGTPEEIFHFPASRFVAEFLGLSCFVPGVVTSQGVQTEFGLQPQPLQASPGTTVEILVRPDDLALRADPDGQGRVVRSVFRGMDYLYDVALPSGSIVRCLGAHTERYEPGTAVRVDLAPGHNLACFRNSAQPCELCHKLAHGPSPVTCVHNLLNR
jgi:iron(III) transport system ATP-binding protein